MNNRILHLRSTSCNAINHISVERAKLITSFYRKNADVIKSVPILRARAFEYILKNKSIHIEKGELIVGERGQGPKSTPTYPEITLHSIQDLEELHIRPKVNFQVSDEVRGVYQDEIIPYWQGRTTREKILDKMSDNWLSAYNSGVFTEFQEQRAPGHTVCGNSIYRKGMATFIKEVEDAIDNAGENSEPDSDELFDQWEAMKISANAIIDFATRYANELKQNASIENDYKRKMELVEMEQICRNVPKNRPETFHEALQYYWFIHLGVITEVNPWDSFNPGRLDQHLYPFYQKGIADGSLTHERAAELLQAFWIKFNNHPSPPKIGVTAHESNTYTDFTLINLGGLTADGVDGVNELTWIILDVIEEMRLLQPGSMIQVSTKNPDKLIHRALDIIKTGFGQPSIFNADTIIKQLTWQGKSEADALAGGASGCVESGAFGTEAYFLTGYFNIPKVIEITLFDGIDPVSGVIVGMKTSFSTWEGFLDAFRQQMNYFLSLKIEGNNLIEKIINKNIPVPFLSLLIEDCIQTGKDYTGGGARYNTSYIQGVGLGTAVDSLTSIRKNVFDKKILSIKDLRSALTSNFDNFDSLRFDMIYETEKYGNDNNYADNQIHIIFDTFFNAVNEKPNTRGGFSRINFLPTTSHIYFGSKTGATPDGRKSSTPLSEGISPVQGADIQGPSSVIKSAAKLMQLKTGGTLLNQKFSPDFFVDKLAISKLSSLIRAYFKMDGHHIQFNVFSETTMRLAQKFPEKYGNLIVRVAGYSDYFNDLGKELQDEIIERTTNCNL